MAGRTFIREWFTCNIWMQSDSLLESSQFLNPPEQLTCEGFLCKPPILHRQDRYSSKLTKDQFPWETMPFAFLTVAPSPPPAFAGQLCSQWRCPHVCNTQVNPVESRYYSGVPKLQSAFFDKIFSWFSYTVQYEHNWSKSSIIHGSQTWQCIGSAC